MRDRLTFALQAATEAGNLTLPHFHERRSFDLKADGSPVSAADREAESYLRKEIHAAFPGEAILGEEEGETGSGSGRWVIDPIDGTKSFVSGVPLYATLLSFELEGVTQVGVAYFPALNWTVWASFGNGAFSNGDRAEVSPLTDLQRAVICCGGHASMEKQGRTQGILNLAARTMATRTWCDAYGHCLVAIGHVEAMVDPVLAPYDISAIRLIIEEAGGRCTDFIGNRQPQTQAISSNSLLHDTILEAFRT